MKNLQMLVALFLVMNVANAFASRYEKPEDNRRASKTVRNSPENTKAKKIYLDAAQGRKLAEDKVKAPKASSQAK